MDFDNDNIVGNGLFSSSSSGISSYLSTLGNEYIDNENGLSYNNFDVNDSNSNNDNGWIRSQRRRVLKNDDKKFLCFGEIETGIKRQRDNRVEIEMESKRQKVKDSPKNDYIPASYNQNETILVTSDNSTNNDLSNLMLVPSSYYSQLPLSSSHDSLSSIPIVSSNETWIATPWGQIVSTDMIKNNFFLPSNNIDDNENFGHSIQESNSSSTALVVWKDKAKALKENKENFTTKIPYSWDQNRVEFELLQDDSDDKHSSSISNMDID